MIDSLIVSCKVLKKSYKHLKTEYAVKAIILGIKEEIAHYKLCRKRFREIRKTTVRGSKVFKVLLDLNMLIKNQENKLTSLLQTSNTEQYFELHEIMGSLRALRTIFNLALLEFALFSDSSEDTDETTFEFLPTLLSGIEEDED